MLKESKSAAVFRNRHKEGSDKTSETYPTRYNKENTMTHRRNFKAAKQALTDIPEKADG